jgi:hypothetical protein
MLELALMDTNGKTWALFKDYTPNNPHSLKTADIKTALARLTEHGMIHSVAGRKVRVKLVGGIRKYLNKLGFGGPLVDQLYTFSATPGQSVIAIRHDTYCGKAPKKTPEPSEILISKIARRNEIHKARIGAKQIVQRVLSETAQPREAVNIVREAIKSEWQPLPKVAPQTSTGIELTPASDYFWVKRLEGKEVTDVNEMILAEG